MKINILYRPAHTMAQIWLAPNESIVAEAGAMVGMSTNLALQTQTGGLLKGLKRLFAGETLFRNTFTAEGGNGELLLAHALCGDMAALELTPPGYFLASSAFIASSPHVEIETRGGGLRGFFSGAGMFVLKATSQAAGQIVVGGFGGIVEMACDGNLVIDTGHLVAWDAALQYKVGRSGSGWIASLFSGEGLVCHFSGKGRVWVQTRNSGAYGSALGRVLPARVS